MARTLRAWFIGALCREAGEPLDTIYKPEHIPPTAKQGWNDQGLAIMGTDPAKEWDRQRFHSERVNSARSRAHRLGKGLDPATVPTIAQTLGLPTEWAPTEAEVSLLIQGLIVLGRTYPHKAAEAKPLIESLQRYFVSVKLGVL